MDDPIQRWQIFEVCILSRLLVLIGLIYSNF
jgi:hypothetical protein